MKNDTSQNTLLDWLGLANPPSWMQSRKVGGFFGFLVMAFGLLMIIGALVADGMFFAAMLNSGWGPNRHTDARNYALVLAALIGAPFIVWRAFVVQKQADIAEQGLITDRINKAVEGLGAEKSVNRAHDRKKQKAEKWDDTTPRYYTTTRTKPNLEVRLGAIYALERISQDSERDQLPNMKILCAYVRENAPVGGSVKISTPKTENTENVNEQIQTQLQKVTVRVDIQSALSVIGNINELVEGNIYSNDSSRKNMFELDLRDSNLQNADLSSLNLNKSFITATALQGVNLSAAKLKWSVLSGAPMQNAILSCTELQGSLLNNVKLQGAVIFYAQLQGADLREAKLAGSNVMSSNFSLCAVTSTDLSKCRGLSQEQVNSMFGDAATKLPEGLSRLDHWPKKKLDSNEFYDLWRGAKKLAGLS